MGSRAAMKSRERGRSVIASSFLHLPVGCEHRRYLQNTQKHNKQVCFSFSFFVFRSASLPSPFLDLLLSLFLKICQIWSGVLHAPPTD